MLLANKQMKTDSFSLKLLITVEPRNTVWPNSRKPHISGYFSNNPLLIS